MPVATRPAGLAHPYAAGEEGEMQVAGQFLAPFFTMHIYASQVVPGQLVRWGGDGDFSHRPQGNGHANFRPRRSARGFFGAVKGDFGAW